MTKYLLSLILVFAVCLIPEYLAKAESAPGGSGSDKKNVAVALEETIMAQKKANLDKLEKEIENKKLMLTEMQNKLNQLMDLTEKFNAEVTEECRKIKVSREEQVEKMVKIYETMPAEDAATRLGYLEKDDTLIILQQMKSKKVAEILAYVEPQKAAGLSAELMNRK